MFFNEFEGLGGHFGSPKLTKSAKIDKVSQQKLIKSAKVDSQQKLTKSGGKS
jgi:hypothetical protein